MSPVDFKKCQCCMSMSLMYAYVACLNLRNRPIPVASHHRLKTCRMSITYLNIACRFEEKKIDNLRKG